MAFKMKKSNGTHTNDVIEPMTKESLKQANEIMGTDMIIKRMAIILGELLKYQGVVVVPFKFNHDGELVIGCSEAVYEELKMNQPPFPKGRGLLTKEK